jgi:hypothetical protein
MNQFSIQPVFRPRSELIIIVHFPRTMLKQRIVHIAFGRSNNQFALLISAVVEVLAGMVIVNVVVEVLSAPKSITAMDLLLCEALYIRAHRAVIAPDQDVFAQFA